MNQENKISVQVTVDDFRIIRGSLLQTVSFWNHLVEHGEYPQDFNENKAREIIKMNEEVLKKIEMILTMKPIPSHNVGVENYNEF